MTVSGTTTYVNTTELKVGDAIITLNADLPQASAPTENAGIEVERGTSDNAAIIWNETTDKWTFTNDGTVYSNMGSAAAESYSNSAYSQANTATTNAATADQRAVTSGSYANAAFALANTVNTNDTAARSYANGAFAAANTADQRAVTSGSYANSAYTLANTKISTVAITTTSPLTGGGTAASFTLAMPAATSTVNGYMTSTYASKLDGIAASATNVTNTNQLTNGAGFISSVAITTTAPLTGGGTASSFTLAMPAATAAVNGYMTSTYASKLDGIAAGATNVTNTNQLTNGAGYVTSSGVTSVTGTAPVVSSGGTTPAISMAAATASVNGYMTSTYASKLDGIAAGATNVTNNNQISNGAGYVTSSGVTSVATGNGLSGGTITTTGTLTMSGSYTGTFAVTGAITSTADITAYYSDERLKKNITPISDALSKVHQIKGVTYQGNDIAASYGYDDKVKVGVIAQDLEKVLPQVVVPAPFDTDKEGNSISGENYKTVQYEKIVPLLIEAIKELSDKVKELEAQINK